MIRIVLALVAALFTAACAGPTKVAPPKAESVDRAVSVESAATSGGRTGVDVTAAVVRTADVDPVSGGNLPFLGYDARNQQVGGHTQTRVVQTSESTDKAVITAAVGAVVPAAINAAMVNVASRRAQCNSAEGCGNTYNVQNAIAESASASVNNTQVNAGVNTNPRRRPPQPQPQGK